ncbi:GGDEF domain-containing protein [Ideonella livida]|uniref:diguanylate cyclase n=1 Tax=Ideonella livida TaxID=2707176 RepID=A0A7C9TL41_9BURK|nr:GGDEF domain-containing protein [Ideonella livida]NDY93259.1 GGDEF domain-containing protein [Ideonella livida]
MSELVIHLATLAGLRDRDALDQALVRAMSQCFPISAVQWVRLVGEGADRRWLPRLQWCSGGPAALVDTTQHPFEHWPRLDERPSWAAVLSPVAPALQADGALVWPVLVEGAARGVLVCNLSMALGPLQRERLEALIDVWRHVHGLLDYSERDTLTGLANRKSFDESFYKASALPMQADPAGAPGAERRGVSTGQYWLGVIDVDHFKQVNDRFGHLIGDEVLLLLSRVMLRSFRHDDLLYRFGGEEFVVLLRCGSAEHARLALERFALAVRTAVFPQVGSITVSVGYTDVRAGDTPSAAVARADQAVYHAKAHGRDQVCHHGTLVAQGLLAAETSQSDVEFF